MPLWPVIFPPPPCHVHAHQASHIHPRNDPCVYSNAHGRMLSYKYAHVSTHRGALLCLPPWSQGHSVNIYWSFDGFTATVITASLPSCFPPFHLLLFLLLLESSAGLSLLYHGVINHAIGSGTASNFQHWLKRAGLQLQAKTIWSLFLIYEKLHAILKKNVTACFL